MREKQRKYADEKGAVALSSISVLAMILLAVGLTMAFSGFIESNLAFEQDKASAAFYISEAGAKDAMQKIARNKKYNNAGYTLTLDNGSANVIVSKDTPSSGQTQILSAGTSGSNTKKVKVILGVSLNGNVTINSWEELAN